MVLHIFSNSSELRRGREFERNVDWDSSDNSQLACIFANFRPCCKTDTRCGRPGAVRGEDPGSEGFFRYVRLEERIAADHPLRAIRDVIDEALRKLSPASTKLYARGGRPSIPPERLLRALLLQAFYTVRSDQRQLRALSQNVAQRVLSCRFPQESVSFDR
jgi:hypothetical protein